LETAGTEQTFEKLQETGMMAKRSKRNEVLLNVCMKRSGSIY